MKDYNEEYFYLRRTGSNYPLLQYARGGGDSMEVFDRELLDTTEARKTVFGKPIPRSPKIADHHFLTVHAPVISERLRNVLENFNLKDVQFLPAIIQDKKGVEHVGYYIIHVVNFIQCMDKEKSKWKPSRYDKERASEIDKLVLDNEILDKIPLENRLVFSTKECNLKVLYHRSVIEKILELEPTGLTIYRLSEWDSKIPFIESYVAGKLNDDKTILD